MPVTCFGVRGLSLSPCLMPKPHLPWPLPLTYQRYACGAGISAAIGLLGLSAYLQVLLCVIPFRKNLYWTCFTPDVLICTSCWTVSEPLLFSSLINAPKLTGFPALTCWVWDDFRLPPKYNCRPLPCLSFPTSCTFFTLVLQLCEFQVSLVPVKSLTFFGNKISGSSWFIHHGYFISTHVF